MGACGRGCKMERRCLASVRRCRREGLGPVIGNVPRYSGDATGGRGQRNNLPCSGPGSSEWPTPANYSVPRANLQGTDTAVTLPGGDLNGKAIAVAVSRGTKAPGGEGRRGRRGRGWQ